MKIELTVKKEFDVAFLVAICKVRHWESAIVNGIEDEYGDLIPCRNGDNWNPIISIESGRIINWEKGKTASVYYKVCDAGEYILQDSDGVEIKKIQDYVPEIMCPKEYGYGDYVIMDVDDDGMIQNWKVTLDEFINEPD